MKAHIDFDCYFVSAERILRPSLRGEPVAIIAGSDDGFFENNVVFTDDKISFMANVLSKNSPQKNISIKHSTIIAASYEAKACGVRVGDKVGAAFCKCQNLKIICSNLRFYKFLSQKVRMFLQSQLPAIEQFSIDEFFAELKEFQNPDEAIKSMKELQLEIFCRFGLPVSIGICKSKWAAKFLTDLAKPFGVRYEKDLNHFLQDKKLTDFPGLGKKSSQYLKAYGINSLDKVLNNREFVRKFGKNGEKIINRLNASDFEEIEELQIPKSHGISKSFKPIKDANKVLARIEIMAKYLILWIKKHKFNPKNCELLIRYELKNLRFLFALSKPFSKREFLQLYQQEKEKIRQKIKNKAVFFISFTVNDLDISDEKRLVCASKNHMLDSLLAQLKEKYGINSINFFDNF